MRGLVLTLVGIFLFFAVLVWPAGIAATSGRVPWTVPGMEDPDYTGPVINFKYLPPERLAAVLEARAARAAASKVAEEKVAEEPSCSCKEQVAAMVKQEPQKQAAPKVAAAPATKKLVAVKAKKTAAKNGKEGKMSEGLLALAIIAVVAAIAIVAVVAMGRRQQQSSPCAGHNGNGGHASRQPQPQAGQANASQTTRQS